MGRGEKDIEREIGEERGKGRNLLMYLVMNTSMKETKVAEIERVSDQIQKIVVSNFCVPNFRS